MANFNSRYPTFNDLLQKAKHHIPRFVFDYLDSGSGEELAVARNREAWNKLLLRQNTMRDVSEIDTTVELFGTKYNYPFAVAPMGAGNLIWPGAECALARAASKANIPYVISMVGSTSLEDVAEVTHGNAWFQLYPTSDWSIGSDLITRAKSAGYRVLIVTVDVPMMPKREREMRYGLQGNLSYVPRLFWDIATHPEWSLRTLIAGKHTLKNMTPYIRDGKTNKKAVAKAMRTILSLGTSNEFLRQVRDAWDGILVIKGILSVDDAKNAVSIGADGLIVSNHGGRVLDAAEPTADILPNVVQAVDNRVTVMVDSGVRSGLDIMKALALGAKNVFLGRPFLFSVGALGLPGADHAMMLLQDECNRAMRQLGITCINKQSIDMIKVYKVHHPG